MKHTVTLERTVTERIRINLDVEDGAPPLNTAVVEGYAQIAAADERDGEQHTFTPWRVVDANPPILTATVTVKGGPTGKRIRSPRRSPAGSKESLHTETAPVSEQPFGEYKPAPVSESAGAGPADDGLDIPDALRRTPA